MSLHTLSFFTGNDAVAWMVPGRLKWNVDVKWGGVGDFTFDLHFHFPRNLFQLLGIVCKADRHATCPLLTRSA
jgi:hypothetical protein